MNHEAESELKKWTRCSACVRVNPARSHTCIFNEVANSYDLTRTTFLLNRMYFSSCTIRMNLYECPTPNPSQGGTQIVRVRSYEFVHN